MNSSFRIGLVVALAAGVLAAGWSGRGAFPAPGQTAPGRRALYVATSGSDANPGSAERPWRTLRKACASAALGDIVYIRPGTYNERLVPRRSGASGREITFAALGEATVILDGSGIPIESLGGVVDLSERGFIRVLGLRVRNSQDAGILADGGHDLLIKGCHTSNTASSGIGIWNSRRVVIEANLVEQAGAGGMQECLTVAGTDTFEVKNNVVRSGRKEGICLKDGACNGRVLLNRVHDVFSVGIYVDAWDKHTHHIEVARNVAHDVVEGDGFSIASEMGGLLENVRLHNNIAYRNRFVGCSVSVNGPVARPPMRDIRIVNNTFHGNGRGEWGGGIAVDNPGATGVLVRNNICSGNVYFQLVVAAEVPAAAVTVDHNLVHPFLATEGETRGARAVSADPRFVNAAAADFRLRPDSPAVDRGWGAGAPTEDFAGAARPRGAAVDIGAFECR